MLNLTGILSQYLHLKSDACMRKLTDIRSIHHVLKYISIITVMHYITKRLYQSHRIVERFIEQNV